MNIREISKPVTAKSLNESLARKFGQKINIDAFTLEQLQDARNRIRTKLSQVETNESFDTVHKDESYQKSKLFLDVLNAAISERSDIAEADDSKKAADEKRKKEEKKKKIAKIVDEGSKPDFLDIDKDGDKKEPMKKAVADKKKKKANESTIVEGAEDEAELVMAAKDMVDRLTGWMEDTAEMQSQSMLELADAIRDELGSEKSEAFVGSVKPALEQLYSAMEATRTALTSGVGQLTGEGGGMDMPGGDMGDMGDMEAPVDDEALPAPVEGGDDFAAAPSAIGGEEEAGRARRESREFSKKKLAETSRKLATLLSKKK
jgi:hypothetical protein